MNLLCAFVERQTACISRVLPLTSPQEILAVNIWSYSKRGRVWGWGGNAHYAMSCVSFSCIDCEYIEGKGCVLLTSVHIAKYSTWHRASAQ